MGNFISSKEFNKMDIINELKEVFIKWNATREIEIDYWRNPILQHLRSGYPDQIWYYQYLRRTTNSLIMPDVNDPSVIKLFMKEPLSQLRADLFRLGRISPDYFKNNKHMDNMVAIDFVMEKQIIKDINEEKIGHKKCIVAYRLFICGLFKNKRIPRYALYLISQFLI